MQYDEYDEISLLLLSHIAWQKREHLHVLIQTHEPFKIKEFSPASRRESHRDLKPERDSTQGGFSIAEMEKACD